MFDHTQLFFLHIYNFFISFYFHFTITHRTPPTHKYTSKLQYQKGDIPAGRPSNWEERRTSSYAGGFFCHSFFVSFPTFIQLIIHMRVHEYIHRFLWQLLTILLLFCFSFTKGRRSRRNSFSEDSQLTIENFGGSQDQINMIGVMDRRSVDRERKISNASSVHEPTLPARSSIADARGTIQIGYDSDNNNEKEDRESEKPHLKRQNSNTSSSNSSGINQLEDKRKMQSFASLAPSTTTWQQQSINAHQLNEIRKHIL